MLKVHWAPGKATRYNLTDNQLHTFYVRAGTTPVLVQNNCKNPVSPAFEGDPYHRDVGDKRIAAEWQAWAKLPKEVHNMVNGIESGRVVQRYNIKEKQPDWFRVNGNESGDWFAVAIFLLV